MAPCRIQSSEIKANHCILIIGTLLPKSILIIVICVAEKDIVLLLKRRTSLTHLNTKQYMRNLQECLILLYQSILSEDAMNVPIVKINQRCDWCTFHFSYLTLCTVILLFRKGERPPAAVFFLFDRSGIEPIFIQQSGGLLGAVGSTTAPP